MKGGAAPVFSDGAVKSVKKGGGEWDDKDALLGKYKKKLAKFVEIPAEARTANESELEKRVKKNSAELLGARSLPWVPDPEG